MSTQRVETIPRRRVNADDWKALHAISADDIDELARLTAAGASLTFAFVMYLGQDEGGGRFSDRVCRFARTHCPSLVETTVERYVFGPTWVYWVKTPSRDELLINLSDDPNTRSDTLLQTPLHQLVGDDRFTDTRSGLKLLCIEELLRAGADPSLEDATGCTPVEVDAPCHYKIRVLLMQWGPLPRPGRAMRQDPVVVAWMAGTTPEQVHRMAVEREVCEHVGEPGVARIVGGYLLRWVEAPRL